MRWLIFGIIVLVLLGVVISNATLTPASINATILKADMHDYGPAPELTNTIWLNTAAPLRLADLRGKVVAIDMWTFG